MLLASVNRLSYALLCAGASLILQAHLWAGEAPSPHWSFQPIQRPAIPNVANQTWARNPIDHFISARLEKEGLSPSPEADRTTLIRRLSYDVLGIPPEPEEVDAFVKDRSPSAYE